MENETACKVHTKLGLEWHIFHILSSEDIDDVLFVHSLPNAKRNMATSDRFVKLFEKLT